MCLGLPTSLCLFVLWYGYKVDLEMKASIPGREFTRNRMLAQKAEKLLNDLGEKVKDVCQDDRLDGARLTRC